MLLIWVFGMQPFITGKSRLRTLLNKSFADFSRNLFIPKKKRQQLDSLQAEKFAEQVIIHIEQDESGETVSDSNAAR